LKSIDFCDQIIIIDDFSSDSTLKIARKYAVEIFKRKLDDDYASQRNFGISKAKNDFVLFVDSDEQVSKKLAREIVNLKSSKINGYFIKRQNFLLNKHLKYAEWGDTSLLRLANKKTGKFKRKVHEYWDIKGETCELKNVLYHKQTKNITNYLTDINKYSSLHSNELDKEHKKAYFYKIIFMPLAKLINNLFLKRGFLDGTEGLIMAILMSFHSFLAWTTLWLNTKK